MFLILLLTLPTGSAEELADLKIAYEEAEGDMDVIMDSVLCCTADDEERFTNILKDLIQQGELTDYKAFSKEFKKKKTARQRRVSTHNMKL
jgi:DnaJ family protein C protein 9